MNYAYDALGRLVGVVDQNGNWAVYNYDAVGNLLSINAGNACQFAIFGFTPQQGITGT